MSNYSQEVKDRDDHTCLKCGWSGSSERLEAHHVYPSSNGGADDRDNLVTLCKRCHEHAPDALKLGETEFRVLMEAFLNRNVTPESDILLFGMERMGKLAVYQASLDEEIDSDLVDSMIEFAEAELEKKDVHHHRKWRWYDAARFADYMGISILFDVEDEVPEWYSEPNSWVVPDE